MISSVDVRYSAFQFFLESTDNKASRLVARYSQFTDSHNIHTTFHKSIFSKLVKQGKTERYLCDSRMIHIFDDTASVSAACAARIVELSSQAVRDHGKFYVAMSGGSLPKVIYN